MLSNLHSHRKVTTADDRSVVRAVKETPQSKKRRLKGETAQSKRQLKKAAAWKSKSKEGVANSQVILSSVLFNV